MQNVNRMHWFANNFRGEVLLWHLVRWIVEVVALSVKISKIYSHDFQIKFRSVVPLNELLFPTLIHDFTVIFLQQLTSCKISEQDFSTSNTCVSGHKKDLLIQQKVWIGFGNVVSHWIKTQACDFDCQSCPTGLHCSHWSRSAGLVT